MQLSLVVHSGWKLWLVSQDSWFSPEPNQRLLKSGMKWQWRITKVLGTGKQCKLTWLASCNCDNVIQQRDRPSSPLYLCQPSILIWIFLWSKMLIDILLKYCVVLFFHHPLMQRVAGQITFWTCIRSPTNLHFILTLTPLVLDTQGLESPPILVLYGKYGYLISAFTMDKNIMAG